MTVNDYSYNHKEYFSKKYERIKALFEATQISIIDCDFKLATNINEKRKLRILLKELPLRKPKSILKELEHDVIFFDQLSTPENFTENIDSTLPKIVWENLLKTNQISLKSKINNQDDRSWEEEERRIINKIVDCLYLEFHLNKRKFDKGSPELNELLKIKSEIAKELKNTRYDIEEKRAQNNNDLLPNKKGLINEEKKEEEEK